MTAPYPNAHPGSPAEFVNQAYENAAIDAWEHKKPQLEIKRMADHFNERYTNALRFVIRDDTFLIHCNDSPSYRTVEIQLTAEQSAAITLGTNEWISRAFLEPVPQF